MNELGRIRKNTDFSANSAFFRSSSYLTPTEAISEYFRLANLQTPLVSFLSPIQSVPPATSHQRHSLLPLLQLENKLQFDLPPAIFLNRSLMRGSRPLPLQPYLPETEISSALAQKTEESIGLRE